MKNVGMKIEKTDTATPWKIGTDSTNREAGHVVGVFLFEVAGMRDKAARDREAMRKLAFQEGGDSFSECVG